MKSNFEICVTKVFQDEGGYTNDPADSGGKTNFGITQKETSIDVRHITKEQAKAIYKKNYWDAMKCDDLPSGLDYTVFDYAVNSGVGRSRKVYNQFKDHLDPVKAIVAINNERQAFLNNLAVRRPKDQKFLKGWTNRVSRVKAFSLKLAGKTDKVTPATVGPTAGLGMFAYLYEYLSTNPYLVVGGAIATGLIVWFVVHKIRNRK